MTDEQLEAKYKPFDIATLEESLAYYREQKADAERACANLERELARRKAEAQKG